MKIKLFGDGAHQELEKFLHERFRLILVARVASIFDFKGFAVFQLAQNFFGVESHASVLLTVNDQGWSLKQS